MTSHKPPMNFRAWAVRIVLATHPGSEALHHIVERAYLHGHEPIALEGPRNGREMVDTGLG